MVRTQIQLEEDQSSRLRRVAAEHQVSVAELIRRSVDRYLEVLDGGVSDEERRQRARAASGRFRSGLGDLGSRHDQYLAEAFRE